MITGKLVLAIREGECLAYRHTAAILIPFF